MRTFNKISWGRVSEADIGVIFDALDRALLTPSRLFIEIGCFSMHTSRRIYDHLKESTNEFILFSLDRSRGSLARYWPQKFSDVMDDGMTVFLYGSSADVAKIVHAKFAFIMVDACHCFNCVTQDLKLWAPKVVIGGQLVMHDTSIRIQKDKRDENHPHAQTAVRAAIEQSDALDDFKIVAENEDKPGTQVFERMIGDAL